MFLNALASALGGVLGHFNPLVVGVLLTLGVVLLRPSRGRSGQGQSVARRHSAAIMQAEVEDEALPVRQRAVVGGRRSPAIPPPNSAASPPTARRKPPRGGGTFLSLLLVGLSTA